MSEPVQEDAKKEDVVIPVAVKVDEETESKAEETEPVQEEKQTLSESVKEEYQNRLDNVVENREQIRKDILKVKKDILKYERTERRKERNQKMLDRRAGELTNLNLVMYSVTDIKNVDEDKKKKQSELIAHISELKASIQDADEYLESNRNKNEHNQSMLSYLEKEEKRYDDEVAQIESLIKSTETEDTNN